MTQQDKKDIQLALDNNWEDRLFYYYQLWVSANTVRPQDKEGMLKIKTELTKLVTPKETKAK
jgi:hypothetical protein